MIICGLLLAWRAWAGITGTQKISTHDYLAVEETLDKNPVYCGIPGSTMNLGRITAVQGLTSSQCGTCLRISGNDKDTYVMAVDKGGAGLDLNTKSFSYLFGEDTGLFGASWEPADQSHCSGIISGDHKIPALKDQPPATDPIPIPSHTTSSPCSTGVTWTKCESPGSLSVCVFGSSFIIACPSGKTCATVSDMSYCM
ncbi:hypothetical protein DSO57_1021238 [Entomophthora muscae]|uniref:Uncharacterized protein n=1 Tax=Entomophthora muscae TaxID=34485 RepID=A0ACC2UD40_9FUNG|nr:hypothetical protein DSO57_1021238 [Entomophthora muscae]